MRAIVAQKGLQGGHSGSEAFHLDFVKFMGVEAEICGLDLNAIILLRHAPTNLQSTVSQQQ